MMDRYSVMFCGATGKPEDGQECKGDSSLTEDRILHGSTPQGPRSEGGNFLGAHPSGLYKSLPYSSGGHLGSRCKSPLFSKLNFLGPYTPQRSTFYYLTLQGPTPHFSSEPHSSGPHSLWFHSLEPFSLGAHSSGLHLSGSWPHLSEPYSLGSTLWGPLLRAIFCMAPLIRVIPFRAHSTHQSLNFQGPPYQGPQSSGPTLQDPHWSGPSLHSPPFKAPLIIA